MTSSEELFKRLYERYVEQGKDHVQAAVDAETLVKTMNKFLDNIKNAKSLSDAERVIK